MPSQQKIRMLKARRALSPAKRPGPTPTIKEPRGQVLRYRRGLRDMLDEVETIVRDRLFEKLPALAEEARATFDSDSVRLDQGFSEKVFAIFDQLRVQIGERFSDERIRDLVETIAHDTNAFNRRQVTKQMESLLGISPFKAESGLRELLNTAIRQNVRLVKSVPFDMLDQMETIVAQDLRTGTEVGAIQEKLLKRFDVTESRAELIARDQVGKLQGQLTKFRQQEVGVTRYRWLTSGDERVRPSHRALNGRIFSWDDPPSVGHPGQDYQCRCNAEPIVEDVLAELENS